MKSDGRALIYMGNDGVSQNLLETLQLNDWHVKQTSNIDEAKQTMREHKLHVGLIELTCQHTESYLSQIQEMLQQYFQMEWIALVHSETGLNSSLKHIIAESFSDFHTLPVDPGHLLANVGHAYGMAKMKWDTVNIPDETDGLEQEMVGSSQQIQNLFANIRKVAGVSAPVLITGESGTGKELTAHAIHERSKCANGPFITVNCGAIPHSLIQSELFGYEKGAFTGANHKKLGHFEAAHKGSIFLDEVGDLPLDQQINLLRFLQEGTIQRVGGNEQIPVDVRIIAATHINLEQAVKTGKMREDLYYRLNVLQLCTPPLRKRPGDIELLAHYFFKKFSHEKNKTVKGFSSACLAVMRDYAWEGNVRELVNRIRHAMVMCENRLISAEDLGIDESSHHFHFMSLKEAKDRAEREAILNALARMHNNVTLTAKTLKVSRVTLYRLIEKHRININD
ncbi:Response regulatory protein [Methylophaga thiooxydans]|uniref:Response regulatory protein n=1 Tax=Methylophaga thiooxydans TaxID=392484 RepID=A0A0A0BIL9_9GAMM|nr:sigma-54 dependent transcriptional regulator [Methylophaga thiooxydans]KGM07781.1 Response regulatory protein [Methylophaga thiooxydans]